MPAHNVVSEQATVKLGERLTLIVIVEVFVQPAVDVPVTVYVVVVVGETETEEPDNEPGIHEYVLAPFDVRVVELPLQIVVELADTLKLGPALIVKLRVAVFTHPCELSEVYV